MNDMEMKAAHDKAAADLKAAEDRAAAKRAEDAKVANDLLVTPPARRHQVHVAHVPTPTTEEAMKAVADAKEAADRAVAKDVADRNWQDVLDRAIGQGHPITSSIDQSMVDEEANKAMAEDAKHTKVAEHHKAIVDARTAGLSPDAEARRQRGIDEVKAKADAAAKAKADAAAKQ